MQSHGAELAPWPTHQARDAPHNTGSKRDAIGDFVL
jgi:hypothetical protein